MFTKLCFIVIVLTAITTPVLGLILSEVNYPAWTFTMKIWPFDILYPFETGFAILNGESMTTDSEIRERMELARSEGANVVLFFRHEVIRDYLGEMADTAWANGMVPFFESSSCDGMSGTYLGNDVSFTTLTEKHIPFRILPLETMRMDDLTGIDHVVLAGAVSISDNEFDLIKDKMVYPIGTNGTLDEWGITRNEQIRFPNVVDISSLAPNLPFSILAPPETYIEYYFDNSDSNHYIIFTYNNIITGEIVIGYSSTMAGKVYELDKIPRSISGSTLSIQIGDYLQVIEIRLGGMTSIEHLNQFDSIVSDQNPCLHNSPNPFNSSTSIHFYLQNSAFVSLKIFNFHGQYIKTLVNEHLSSGRHEIPLSDNNLSSGIYLMRLEAGNGSFWRRMIVLR